jgi:hypothetical protein
MVRTATTRVVIVGRVRPQAVDLYAPSHPTHGMEKPANMKHREVDPAQRNGHAEHTLRFLALMDHTVWRDGHAEQTPWFLALREHVVSHSHASPGIICHFTLTTRRLPALQLGRRCPGVDSTANYTAVASETHNDHGPDENALSVPGLTAASLPGTTGQPGAQNPAAPRRSDLASPGFDSSDVSAQTF